MFSITSNKSGFTLIELMVTLVIIGILATVSLPGYQKYVLKAKTAEAYTVLTKIGQSQITFFNENGEFANAAQYEPLYLDPGYQVAVDATWAILGYPLTVGSSTHFTYKSPSGKINGSGTELNTTTLTSSGFIDFSRDDLIYGGYSVSGRCNQNAATAATFGASVQNNYDWTVLSAVGDLNQDRGTSCTAIVRLLEAKTTTDRRPQFRGQFIVLNMGD